ncbi:MAG TPA: hypothetical protein VJB02_02740 [Coxiellaceae bacterium]|nr:hypothetical protein [Coxiellaceae bacterium]
MDVWKTLWMYEESYGFTENRRGRPWSAREHCTRLKAERDLSQGPAQD